MSDLASFFFDRERYSLTDDSAESFHQQYATHHYVRFPGLLRGPGFTLLQQEVFRLRERTFRRDFRMQCMENSPRKMSTLGGDGVEQLSTIIPALYMEPTLLRFLGRVAGQPLVMLSDIDRFVVNDLHQDGDTFGAHFDDYPISLVFLIDGPPSEQGGAVEVVQNAQTLAELDRPDVTRVILAPGDAYMLKADTSAHRVAPLLAPTRRTALNLAYTHEGFVPNNTDSASLLYMPGLKSPLDDEPR